MTTCADIAHAIEDFAPKKLQESYDNAGLQIGNPHSCVTGVLVCLDINTEVLTEAIERGCNMVVCHHPLLFGGTKQITPDTEQGRTIIQAIKADISVYAAHTNLDRTCRGISYEMANALGMKDLSVLVPDKTDPSLGLGIIGEIPPTPSLAFLHKVKQVFGVECLRHSQSIPNLTVKRVAVCGGSGASLIRNAVCQEADAIVTGDTKYHDYTTYSGQILIADIGHYESELCSKSIMARILKSKFQNSPIFLSETERSPITSI